MDYETIMRVIMGDKATSTWVKRAVTELLERDPVDAASDADMVAGLMEIRVNAILEGTA